MHRRKVAISIALPQEARAIFGSRGWDKSHSSPIQKKLSRGQIDFFIFVTGMGKDRLKASVSHLLNIHSPELLINTGVCAGLHEGLRSGDLILPDEIQSKKGEIGLSKDQIISFSKYLLKKGLPVKKGKIFTSDEVILQASQKRTIFKETGALGIDMEAFYVAKTLMKSDCKFFCIKAVSDTSSQSISRDILECLRPNGEMDYLKLLRLLIKKPRLLINLLQMGKGFKRATSSLKKAFEALCSNDLPLFNR